MRIKRYISRRVKIRTNMGWVASGLEFYFNFWSGRYGRIWVDKVRLTSNSESNSTCFVTMATLGGLPISCHRLISVRLLSVAFIFSHIKYQMTEEVSVCLEF